MRRCAAQVITATLTGDGGMVVAPGASAEAIRSLLLAGAQALHVDGDLLAGREKFDAAYRAAERGRDSSAMALSALGLAGLWVHEHRSVAAAALVQARLSRALGAVHPRSSLALRLRARLAGEADYRTAGHARILAVLEEARQVGDPTAWAEAASLAHHCLLGPDHGELRSGLADELIAQSLRTGRRGDLLLGILWRTADLFLDADPHAERCLTELRELLAQRNHLATEYVVRAIGVMLDIRAGRLERAEAEAACCAERGEAAGDIDANGWHAGHLVTIRWYQGRIAELLPTLRDIVNSPTLSAVDNSHIAALAVAAATAGDHREAAGALARLGGGDLTRMPRSSTWLVSMYGAVETAYLLGDGDTAATAYSLLAGFAQLPMIASLGAACFGSVRHALGVAALAAGDPTRAVPHLRSAVHDNLALRHWPAVALSRLRLAQALTREGGPDGVPEASRELGLAVGEAASLGMTLPREPGPHPTAAADDTRQVRRRSAGCARRGSGWTVELDGHRTEVQHSVGMVYLAILLANPGYEIPAAELAAAAAPPGTAAADPSPVSAQPVLDEVARREYRRRLSTLQAEIDRYESRNDAERAARASAERDWLVDLLRAAAGLGGRVRQFAGTDERARIAVGKAIRRALDRIAHADPAIGGQLRVTVQTGVRCCYRPG